MISSAFRRNLLASMAATGCCVLLASGVEAQAAARPSNPLADKALKARVAALLSKMTLDEKIGQLVQYSAGLPTGPSTHPQDYKTMIAAGEIGSLLNVTDAQTMNSYQRIAVEKSRLHIPLLFGQDVIHGYNTTFPVPLGMAATFDPDLVQAAARMAAVEASNDGIRWAFSPMVDISRDGRWGRIIEGAGEEPYLGAALARAYVHGYQGDRLSDPTSIAACVKHFAAYGAVTAGRDYNTVDMSDGTLRQVYLPTYQAAIDAGAVTVMSSLSSLNGVPAAANPYLLTQILRKEWDFQGFVVSDYGAVQELIAHGIALDDATAAQKALTAGLDMDMQSNVYHSRLAALVHSGQIPESAIDEAAGRVLRVKFALGLFEHPYANLNTSEYTATTEKRALARKAAEESFVLLQNRASLGQPALLPIGPHVHTIALIGPFGDAQSEMLGSWICKGNAADVTTLRTALAARLQSSGGKLLYAQGTQVLTDSQTGFAAAVDAAKQADLVLFTAGEDAQTMTGEASSRAHLGLPGNQQQLLEAIVATGKPVVLLVFSGHPLVLDWAAQHVPAILQSWYPGIEAGPALANILFGDASPSGKLPVSLPYAVGQEPLYLAQFPTGRPATGVDLMHPPQTSDEKYVSRYIDAPNAPLFPYGYGLSYTHFNYSPVTLSAQQVSAQALQHANAPALTASVEVHNAGSVTGTEVVQLYLRIRGASMEEPVRQLEGFERVTLAPGQSQSVRFPLGFAEMSFFNAQGQRVVEPGTEYTVYIGGSSLATQSAEFNVTK
jgi:beta-glucosidase